MNCNSIEAEIIEKIITRALAKGYQIDVRDAYGDDEPPNLELRRSDVAATGETLLDIYNKGRCLGWILLIHGNDEDVVSDYIDHPFIEELVA